MPFKKTSLVLLASIIVIGLVITIQYQEKPAAKQVQSKPQFALPKGVSHKQDKTLDKAIVVLAERQKESEPEKVTESSCMPLEQYREVASDPAVIDWFFTHIGFGKMDAENYMDMDVLLEQAQVENAYAMMVLGSHYVHRAQYVGESMLVNMIHLCDLTIGARKAI